MIFLKLKKLLLLPTGDVNTSENDLELEMDPMLLALRNIVKEGDIFCHISQLLLTHKHKIIYKKRSAIGDRKTSLDELNSEILKTTSVAPMVLAHPDIDVKAGLGQPLLTTTDITSDGYGS